MISIPVAPLRTKAAKDWNIRRFDQVVYFVEATSFETHSLWKRDHHDEKIIKEWEQDVGNGIKVGKVGKHEVWVSFMFNKLDGQWVCFYNATSQVVDHTLVENWIKKNCPVKTSDGRWAMCDADNFHHAIHRIEELNEKAAKAVLDRLGKKRPLSP